MKNSSKVCSLHFKTTDYIKSTDRKILTSSAVPINNTCLLYMAAPTLTMSNTIKFEIPCTSPFVETVTIIKLGVEGVLDWCVFSVYLLF